MAFVIHTDEMSGAVDAACDVVERYGSGLAVNHLLDKARESAEAIRALDEKTKMDNSTLETAQTVLRLAGMVAETQVSDDFPDFESHADTLGSAIWGSSPKGDSARVVPYTASIASNHD